MIALKDVQQKAVDLIKAHATWTAEAVLKDDGKQQKNEDAALRGAGHCAVVLPLLDGNTESQAPKVALLNVGVAVRIEVSPEKGTKDIYLLLADAKAALCNPAPAPLNPNDFFTLSPKAFVIDDSDPGILAYILFLEKACTF